MALRRERFQRTGVSKRRQTDWSVGPSGALELTATGAGLFSNTAVADRAGETIVRTRGELLVYMSSVTGALDGAIFAAGLCIVSENAAGIGVTAVPHPLTDISWDGWFWYYTGQIEAAGDVTEAQFQGQLGAMAVRLEIDSKAMRKVKETDVIIGVVEIIESGTVAIQFRLNTRILGKLA